MAKTSIEQRLGELRGADVASNEGLKIVSDALRAPIGIVVAAAAKRVADESITALLDELAPAFERLLVDPVKRDPGCRGKVAIARALHALEAWDDVLARGASVIQAEPAYGDPVDTAAELRGICGLAHAHLGRPDALDVLATLLADDQRSTRTAAAQGIGDCGRPEGGALLRFKLLIDDDEPAVVAACCEALIHLQRGAAIAFLARFLDEVDDRAEAVVLALGTSRLEGALAHLEGWTERCRPEQRQRVAYLALALSRLDAANARLLEVVRGGHAKDAIAAARALATFKEVGTLREKLRVAARERDRTTREAIEALL